MDIGAGKYLEKGESVEVHTENLQRILGHTAIDPASLRMRLVGFYDKEHAIGQPDEEGKVTITLPLRNAARQLPFALSEYADSIENRAPYGSVAADLTEIGEAAHEIIDKRYLGAAAVGAFPGLLAISALRDTGKTFSAGARRGRKLAKIAKNTPAFSIQRTK